MGHHSGSLTGGGPAQQGRERGAPQGPTAGPGHAPRTEDKVSGTSQPSKSRGSPRALALSWQLVTPHPANGQTGWRARAPMLCPGMAPEPETMRIKKRLLLLLPVSLQLVMLLHSSVFSSMGQKSHLQWFEQANQSHFSYTQGQSNAAAHRQHELKASTMTLLLAFASW